MENNNLISKSEIILITGGSAAGKTFIAKAIADKLKTVTVLSLDNYYYPLTHFNEAKINWDVWDAFDVKRLKADLATLLNFQPVKTHPFLYRECLYSDEPLILQPNKYLIIEGIFATNDEEINQLASYAFFLDSAEDIRKLRRFKRDQELLDNFLPSEFENEWNNIIEKNFLARKLAFNQKLIKINTDNLETNYQEVVRKIIKNLVKYKKY